MATPTMTTAGMARIKTSTGSGGAPAGSVFTAHATSQIAPSISTAITAAQISGAA